jgi:hypothetical protein
MTTTCDLCGRETYRARIQYPPPVPFAEMGTFCLTTGGGNCVDLTKKRIDRLSASVRDVRVQAMKEAVEAVLGFLLLPDEEFERSHPKASEIVRLTADSIDRLFIKGGRIERLAEVKT